MEHRLKQLENKVRKKAEANACRILQVEVRQAISYEGMDGII